ncbi:MAG: hypothetical protein AAB605_04410 [Patescibacteria group bacterium]
MHFGIFSYTATILIFTGLAILLYFLMLFKFSRRSARLPAKYWKVVLAVILINIIATSPAEWAALTWRAWTYNPERTFHTTFLGAEIETYLFTTLVTLVVSLATLLYARREERKTSAQALQ